MAAKNNQTLFITVILIIVLISILFLTVKLYDLNTLNNYYKRVNTDDEESDYETENVNLIPVRQTSTKRWHFWPSNWSWSSSPELGKQSWSINKYTGTGPRGGVRQRQFGNYCPYAGSCPFGGWKGCPYGPGCPGPFLPTIEVEKMPAFQSSFD